MRPKFVETSNVKRFTQALAACEQRGAPEASWVLITGDAGHGKTFTAIRWGTTVDAAIVRITAAATPHWILTDLVRELGEKVPARTCEELFKQAVKSLSRQPRPIVLDEAENACRRGIGCLEVIRDLSDLLELQVVVTGREWVESRLQAQRQIWSRISGLAQFGPLTVEDVRLLRTELLEVETDEALDPIILEKSKGYVREVINALGAIERIGRRMRSPVGPADIEGVSLVREHATAVATPARSRVVPFRGRG